MTSRQQARENKDATRSKLKALGFNVVSIGLRKIEGEWTIEAGILSAKNAPENLEVNDIKVNVRQQSKPRFAI